MGMVGETQPAAAIKNMKNPVIARLARPEIHGGIVDDERTKTHSFLEKELWL